MSATFELPEKAPLVGLFVAAALVSPRRYRVKADLTYFCDPLSSSLFNIVNIMLARIGA